MTIHTDSQFIHSIQHKTIDFKLKDRKTIRALPVGEYLIIGSGYVIYNRTMKTQLLNCKFHSIIDAHKFCLKLIEIYGDLLHILVDEDYADLFFKLTQYTVPNGEYIYNQIQSLDGVVTRSDLAFILDE